MKTTAEAIQLVKEFEGFSATPYRCPAGKWTIGFGTTRGVSAHSPAITRKQAEELLQRDLADAEAVVRNFVRVPLNPNQFSALVSFIHNVGTGQRGIKDGFVWLRNGRNSTMLTLLNDGRYEAASHQFGKWINVKNKPSKGLIRRREAERALFMRPIPLPWLTPQGGDV